jgi:hypothetical protein
MLDQFTEIWLVDFEYNAPDGERPTVACLVARELRSGHLIRLWRDELVKLRRAPFDTSAKALFVAYNAQAELSCFLVLGWSFPVRILDLYVEFLRATNGVRLREGKGLVGALSYFGLESLSAEEKHEMQMLAMKPEHTDEEKQIVLDYCQTDSDALARLLPAMLPKLDDIRRCCWRGRYMAAVARMTHYGIPIDLELLNLIYDHKEEIQLRLIAEVDQKFGVYEGTTFKKHKWRKWLIAHDIPWPLLDSGELALDTDTFSDMSKAYEEVKPIHELRKTLDQLHKVKLEIGSDGRNRTAFWPFRAKTMRNAPSSTKFIFGLPKWMRSLIRARPGWDLAHLDWRAQEMAIAAVFSRDQAMIDAYLSGDPYLHFAKRVGAIPPQGDRIRHRHKRKQYKVVCLSIGYGTGAKTLSQRIDGTVLEARTIMRQHHEVYSTFWTWSDRTVDHAFHDGVLTSVFGWPLRITPETKVNTARNYLVQAAGAAMMQIACCLATEQGVRVLCPTHDALTIEAPRALLKKHIDITRKAMIKAGMAVLRGFKIEIEVQEFVYPARFEDEDGKDLWERVKGILNQIITRDGLYDSKEL